MLDINLNPDRRQLRQFAAIWFPLFCALVGFLVLRGGWSTPAFAIWGTGIVLGLLGAAVPPLIRPVFVVLMVVAYPIGWVISHIVLMIAFYLVLTPIGLVLRGMGRDPLDKGLRPKTQGSFWLDREPTRDPGRYFRQY